MRNLLLRLGTPGGRAAAALCDYPRKRSGLTGRREFENSRQTFDDVAQVRLEIPSAGSSRNSRPLDIKARRVPTVSS